MRCIVLNTIGSIYDVARAFRPAAVSELGSDSLSPSKSFSSRFSNRHT